MKLVQLLVKKFKNIESFEASILDLKELLMNQNEVLDAFEETFDYRASYDNFT